MNESRQYSLPDRVIGAVDNILRNLTDTPQTNQPLEREREYPPGPAEQESLSPNERLHSGRLMRVNHVGEVCAQALYLGQAAVAADPGIANSMRQSAKEEQAHLSWCNRRIQELNGRKSYLNPFWAGGSLVIGMIAGVAGDEKSLGFIEETEAQVCAHLDNHLVKLPKHDRRSRKIVREMRNDEAEHAERARKMGARSLPTLAKLLMKAQAKIMTTVAYRI